jgi:recombinational DNA repair ATPase RecF
MRDLQDRRGKLNVVLDERGREGIAERFEAAQRALEGAQRERRDVHRRAAAAELLYVTLNRRREETRDTYRRPLANKIAELGRPVFGPDFEVSIGDHLEVVSRTMKGRTIQFSSLSGGAQEQIALLARLACARIVDQDSGVPVILDDILGYSDPDRLETMGAVLSIAGRETQVIVLTCTPDRYRFLTGAKVVEL